MTHEFKLARRAVRLRALLLPVPALIFGACDSADRLTNVSDDPSSQIVVQPVATPIALSFSSSSSGGIPFGMFHLPNDLYGSKYNGSVLYRYPEYLLADLEAARRAGARVIVDFVGGEKHFKNGDGTFSLAKWKQRVERYRDLNFSSYIEDGTIIGHYILDEPHDASNWHGTLVSPATIDEMAGYSKELWPSMPTIVRSWPSYLKGYDYKHLDAAWAQYSERKGEASKFISENVRDAKAAGLALILGMNLLDGGTKASGIPGYTSGKYSMSASQVRSWGSALLDDPYPCAFMSWRYNSSYMSRSDVESAISDLSQKARDHTTKSCRTKDQPEPATDQPIPPVTEAPAPPVTGQPAPLVTEQPAPPVTEQPAPPIIPQPTTGVVTPSRIKLKVNGRVRGNVQYMSLDWTGAKGSRVDVYREGARTVTTENDGHYVNSRKWRGQITYVYKVCEKRTSICSRSVSIALK